MTKLAVILRVYKRCFVVLFQSKEMIQSLESELSEELVTLGLGESNIDTVLKWKEDVVESAKSMTAYASIQNPIVLPRVFGPLTLFVCEKLLKFTVSFFRYNSCMSY